MYKIEATQRFENDYSKLAKKNKKLADALKKKLKEILNDPYRFKPLRKPLQGFRRVHLLGCYVLVYTINEKKETVVLIRLAHHDDAYSKKLVKGNWV